MAKERAGSIGRRQALLLFATQIVLLVLMGLFTTYGPEADAKLVRNYSGSTSDADASNGRKDPMRIYSRFLSAIFDFGLASGN